MKLMPFNEPIKDINFWINSFLNSKKSQNISANTYIFYKRALYDFEDFLRGYADEISLIDLSKRIYFELYIQKLLSRLSANSAASYFVAIKTFFKYISELNDEQIDFARTLSNIKIKKEKKVKQHLAENEVYRLLDYLEKLSETEKYRNVRDAFLVKLLLETGMRADSLLKLKFKDFTETSYWDKRNKKDVYLYKIKIMQKGGKENFVYARKDLIDFEIDYLLRYWNNNKNINVASTKNGNTINRQRLYQITKRVFKKAAIDKKGVHIFRHTFVYLKRIQGVDLSTIQALLGHSSITTTINIYGKASEMDKMKAAAQIDYR